MTGHGEIYSELKPLLDACLAEKCADARAFRKACDALFDVCTIETIASLVAENEKQRKALFDLLDLYDTDEGCRSLPQYIAGRAALSKEPSNV